MANPSPADGGLTDAGADASASFPATAVDDPTGICGTPKDAADWSGGVPPPPIVSPLIWIQTPIVLVKKPYTAKPNRQPVLLSTDQAFDGKGTFTVTSGAGKIRFFSKDTGGYEILSGHVFPGALLSIGTILYAQGEKPSNSEKDVTIELALTPGCKPVNPPVASQMTSVELTLDICKSRTKTGESPPPLSDNDKIKVGRFVQSQDPGVNAGRALLVVHQAEPKSFTGTLVLSSKTGKLKLFKFADDPPTAGQAGFVEVKKSNTAIPAAGLKFWLEGTATSAAMRDTGYSLGVDGVDPEGDFVKVTVVAFSEIAATIKPTPPHTHANSRAAGIASPTQHIFKSSALSRDFAVNAPIVLMKNAQPDISLEIKCAPAGLPIRWQAIRNEADHNSLGKKSDVPTVTRSGADAKKATLQSDGSGSFRVRAYIDCNGNRLYDDMVDREPSIPLNLVLANAVVVKDNSAGNSGGRAGTLQANVTGGGIDIVNGLWPGGATVSKADLGRAGMGMELIADITGGGADGQLGLDRVFSGLINNLSIVDINATYLDSTVAPPKNWNWVNVYVSNRPASNIFPPGGPVAPKLLAWPILDTGRHPGEGTGGEMATMTMSVPQTSVNRPVGQRWTIRCVDSPKRSFSFLHPLNANATVQRIHYRQEFAACFCFWTNINKSRGASFPGAHANDPADRVYSVLRIVAWHVTGDWKVTYPGGVPTLTATATHKVSVPSRRTLNPIARAQDNAVEVRPPSGITGAIAWNAR
jgi:hypothetical protein